MLYRLAALRHVAIRYDKLVRSHLTVVQFAAIPRSGSESAD